MPSSNANNAQVNTNANSPDLSDVRPDGAQASGVSPTQLPIRGEKRIIPCPISPIDLNDGVTDAFLKTGNAPPTPNGPTGRTVLSSGSDFYVTAAMEPFVDYVIVRIPGRGLTSTGTPAGNGPPAVFRFLINPATVQVSRTTLDGQAMTRAGWQIGVWGEDSLSITMSGKTAGQYFSFGLTDALQPYTESWRNLEQLLVVFENNGYWFEGEQLNEGPLAADFTRRRIKMHQDVELWVGNFIWYGMFDSLTVSQDANAPYLMNFSITFVAWKERFRRSSPYANLIPNNVQRGHTYGAWKPTALTTQQGTTQNSSATNVTYGPPPPVAPQSQPALQSPSVDSSTASNTFPENDPTSSDFLPYTPWLIDPTLPGGPFTDTLGGKP
jgi:hypothetical protein